MDNMDDQQQNLNNKVLNAKTNGEAGSEGVSEYEVNVTPDEIDDQTDNLMEEVLTKENLMKAYEAVVRNAGAPGVDGIRTEDLQAFLAANWLGIREQLLTGRYKPRAIKRKEIPKSGGGTRKLGIPTVVDRFIQQALLQVLQPKWDATFSEHSYGFRPGRSAKQAVQASRECITSGKCWVVDMDLEKFFDRVNHDVLMTRVAKRVKDMRVVKVIRAYLNAGILEDGLVKPLSEGVPQGGPLSPLLSNLLLDELDRELERRQLHFVRYADDCNIYVASQRAGERVLTSITEFLAKRLRLKVNKEKSGVGKPWTRTFLGFDFLITKGKARIRLARKSRDRFQKRVRELTRRAGGRSVDQVVTDLRKFLVGWYGYFQLSDVRNVFDRLDKWVRRRLRLYMWRQWKTSTNRFSELVARGCSTQLAASCAASQKSGWRIAASQGLSVALPNAYFRVLGIPTMGRSA